MNLFQKMMAVMLGLSLVLGLGGCSCTPKLGNYTVTVKLSDQFGEQFTPFDVDLIGLTPADKAWAESKSVSTYFSGSDADRNSFQTEGAEKRRIPLTFGPGRERSYTLTLDKKSELYNQWKNQVRYLGVFAQLEGVSASGGTDPRRGVLSLDQCDWGGRRQLDTIVISPTRVAVPTPPEKK